MTETENAGSLNNNNMEDLLIYFAISVFSVSDKKKWFNKLGFYLYPCTTSICILYTVMIIVDYQVIKPSILSGKYIRVQIFW